MSDEKMNVQPCLKQRKRTSPYIYRIPYKAQLVIHARVRGRDRRWRGVRFSDECSVQINSGGDREWCFRLPDEAYRHEMVEEKSTGRPPQQMVWGQI